MDSSFFAVSNFFIAFGGIKALQDISFTMEQGEIFSVSGPNGAGKTTLFKCCMKFLTSHKGSVIMDGTDINECRIEDMAKVVAYVPQEHKPPFPYLVKEVVLMGRTPQLGGFFGDKRADKEKALEDPSVAVGEKLFLENCSECHPRRGRRDYLEKIPATLLTRKSQNELMDWNKGSNQPRGMTSFYKITDEKRSTLANYFEIHIRK